MLFTKLKKARRTRSSGRKILGYEPNKILKFFVIAEAVASLSKDPSTKVGAVALDRHLNILSTGWNGFPRGVDDALPTRLDRNEKLFWTCHAEGNCIAQAARTGARLNGGILLVTSLFPCSNCASLVIQAGIKHIFAKRSPPDTRWAEHDKRSKQMFKEAKVRVHYVDRRVDFKTDKVLWSLEPSETRLRNGIRTV